MSGRRDRGGGRGPQRRRAHLSVVRPAPSALDEAPELELIQTLRRSLRDPEPISLLMTVSGLLSVLDERTADPFDRTPGTASVASLVESFIDIEFAETTAALTVMAALVADEQLVPRIDREISVRRQPMPAWLRGLREARPEPEVWFLSHVLGDGDDYLIGVTLPNGEAFAALVYIDHNLGTVVKDAFVAPVTLVVMVEKMRRSIDSHTQTLVPVDARDARAAIEQAIAVSSMQYPRTETETWPLCRPLVEWICRMLPSGGTAPALREWSEAALDEIARDFFASEFSLGLDGPDDADIMQSLLWFGSGYCGSDPLRWSPVNVEILLVDWVPRKIMADVDFLARIPTVLRAFIRHCHAERGISRELTEETIAFVARWEPEYQRTIRSARRQGPQALLAAMGVMTPEALYDDAYVLSILDARVGGRDQLMSLDATPLPDEPFKWAGIPDDIRPVVQVMLDECDRVATELLDAEYRTVMRRLLSRAAVGDSSVFRRKASPVRGAAAVAWLAFRANDDIEYRDIRIQDLLAGFGVAGSVTQRADSFLRALGINPHDRFGRPDLGAPDLLTGPVRTQIIARRDRVLGP
ncbi:MAG: hypothetical protein NTX29_05570 [Actinobacteria bacterium]|nr:hypothetical protein [Actinomycetota bacterium]